MLPLRSETPPPPASLDFGLAPDSAAPNVAQLKADIDSGRTGDKAPHGDVGAAPLGTCEEAGGVPPSPQEIREARRYRASPSVRAAVDPHGERSFVMPLFWATAGSMAGLVALGLVFFPG
ncbi:hypothetical protein [Methylorubrum salsuginis]|uniref:Uncharacterized protein n=1 Tax=Methylorubrum salsuginis TaxID=414703 RepID=A0A1I3YV15_9HYPH|nr:hypothetical protein [Methylorubrum salsuginis]SFK35209.1 hypothetical protein SAMN04488125_101359 [Methylorubrum salsuginis]